MPRGGSAPRRQSSGFAEQAGVVEGFTAALTKIANAGEYINGMVIDPCPTVLCMKRETKDVAASALATAARSA